MGKSISWKAVLVSLVGCPLLAMGCGDDGGSSTEDSSTGDTTSSSTGTLTSSTSSTSSTGSTGSTGTTEDDTSSTSEGSTASTDMDDTSVGEPEGTESDTTGDAAETSDSTSAPADDSTGASTGVDTEDAIDDTGTESTGDDSTGAPDESESTGGETEDTEVPDTLDNPGFETGETRVTLPGWSMEGTSLASYVEYNGQRSGVGRLGHWFADPYTVRTYQLVSPIPNGTYTFSMWVQRGDFDEQYLFARGYSAENQEAELTMSTDAAGGTGYTQIILADIPVTSGAVEVGIYSAASVGGAWANIDDAELVLQD